MRPSVLPKLEQCAQFESSPEPSAAAARGTRVDEIFRWLIEHGIAHYDRKTEHEEHAVAKWASGYVKRRCGAEEVFASESHCRISCIASALEMSGTMDAVCPSMHLLFDLKTGEIRDYEAQMAAYALGCMQKHRATEWTAVLVFADKRMIREHHFSLAEADEMVSGLIAKASRGPQPTVCEYCEWCAKRGRCKAVAEAIARATGTVMEGSLDAICSDDETLSRFLADSIVLEKAIESARDFAKSKLIGGGSVSGWRLQRRSGRSSVSTEALRGFFECDVTKLLPKTVSEKTAREALPSLPDSLIERGSETIALVQSKKQKD